MSLSIILPCYQEEENLRVLLPEILNVVKDMGMDYEVIVIDTINVNNVCKSICAQNNVLYVNREGSNTYGDAIRTGIKKARYDYILVMDADGSHNPKDIKKLYENILLNNDVVIGSRYIEGGNTNNNVVLKSMSYLLNMTYRVIFNLKINDISNSFKIYKRSQLQSIRTSCKNFDIVEEILIRLKTKYNNIKIKEVPIEFSKRKYGKSKRNLLVFIVSYISTIFKLYKIKIDQKKNNH